MITTANKVEEHGQILLQESIDALTHSPTHTQTQSCSFVLRDLKVLP